MRSEPKQTKEFRQVFKGQDVGQKRWKTGGGETEILDGPEDWPKDTCKPTHVTSPPNARRPKGSYLDSRRFYAESRKAPDQKPITKTSIKLLVDFHKRRAFLQAIANGAPVEWSGKELLGKVRSDSYQIRKEMPDGAHDWFVGKFLEGLGSRKILEGAATERSDIADNFFTELAGGKKVWDSLRYDHGARAKVMVREQLRDYDVVVKQVASYGIFSHAFYTGGE
jgi:hypothetical protein